MRTVNGLLDNKYIDRSVWIRPIIDVQKFRNLQIKRDIEYLYVGSITEYKGYDNIKKRFGHLSDFWFVGHNATNEKLFGRHIEYIPNNEIPILLNRAKNFVHLPVWMEPMGRTVVEAALCGCNIISNDNVGALSFPFDIANPEMIKGSARLFWDELLKRVKNKIDSEHRKGSHG
jgi:glycosyltransferase involved in cell wall biosynthesis